MDRHLRVVPADDYDQVVRLAAFRRRYPDVVVSGGGSARWRAEVPGRGPVVRYELKDLLDVLERLLAA